MTSDSSLVAADARSHLSSANIHIWSHAGTQKMILCACKSLGEDTASFLPDVTITIFFATEPRVLGEGDTNTFSLSNSQH